MLLPVLIVAIFLERGWLPGILSMFGKAFIILFIVLAALSLVRFFMRGREYEYIKPRARYIADGLIEVHGDVEWLQSRFHEATSVSTWTKFGHRYWKVEMPNCNKWQTEDVVSAINSIT